MAWWGDKSLDHTGEHVEEGRVRYSHFGGIFSVALLNSSLLVFFSSFVFRLHYKGYFWWTENRVAYA